ncbi:MAG: hypothetical protein AAB467_00790 [Patescibacteria group bacterium]
MIENRLISLHPKLAATADFFVSIVFLWLLSRIETVQMTAVWFAARIGWWIFLTQIMYYPPYLDRFRHLVSLFIANAGVLPFLIFADPSNILYARLATIILSFVSFYLVPAEGDSLSVMEKPHRRWKFFMSLFGVAGIWLTLQALVAFQVITGYWTLGAIAGASFLTAAISALEWDEYGVKSKGLKFFVLLFLIFLTIAEIGGIVYLWPVGYFVSSFFITWVWFLVWLLFRFDLSETGIDWPRQRFFLISNLILMVAFLTFVVRWK